MKLLLVIALGVLIWRLPHPEVIAPEAWQLFSIFVATVVGLVIRPLPMGAVAFLGITATILSATLPLGVALGGFSNSVIWLIVAAFFIARGIIKTGLGERIAYQFMARFGRSSLGLGYSLVATDLVLAPALPSNTARAGGVIFPVLQGLAQAYGSEAQAGTSRRLAAFLAKTSFQGTNITSAMFLTAMAANPLAAQLAAPMGIEITWGVWAVAAVIPGILSLVLVPLLLYALYPPEIRETPKARDMALTRLAEMGPMRREEQVMLGVFVMLLFLWVLGGWIGLSPTAAAFAGLAVLLITGVLTWSDFLEEKEAWNTLVWFSALVMMAGGLQDLGMIPWFSRTVGGWVAGEGWVLAFLVLSLTYFYSHYFFASNTAHVGAMYAPFLAVALAVGTPPLLAALVLGFFSSLFSSMTHYGTGPAPIFFGSGHVELAVWWRLGAVVSIVNILIWVLAGGLWWKLLGIW